MTTPEGWTKVKLSEIADIGWGDLSVTKKSYVVSGYTAFSATGADGFLPYFDYDQDGIVVSAIGANCGKIWRAYGKWSCIKNTMRILIKDSPVLLDYLFYYLSDPSIFPKRGSGQPFISKEDARDIEIAYPSIDEQRKIVELLEHNLSHLNAGLAEAKQAKMKVFQFKIAFLRKVFSGDASWNSVPMKKLGKWGGGGTPSKSNEKFWINGTVPWLSPKDMGSLEITNTVDKITEEACLNSTVKKIPANSVVFVVRSGILERKLPMALTKVETTLNQDMKALTFSEEILPKFGFYAMLGLEQDILRTCRKSGTTVASINTESLMNYEIRIPSLDIQREVLDFVESQLTLIDKSLPQIEFVLNVGINLRRSLLQEVFTGDLSMNLVSYVN